MEYTNILVALDLVEESDKVINRAINIANHKAKISIVHVVEPLAMAFGGDVPMDLSVLQQEQLEQAKKKLNKFSAEHPTIDQSDCHLVCGQPRQEIHNIAKKINCNLIIVGSHGRHGLALLLGSTANEVLHGAKCDVLAVRLDD